MVDIHRSVLSIVKNSFQKWLVNLVSLSDIIDVGIRNLLKILSITSLATSGADIAFLIGSTMAILVNLSIIMRMES